MTTFKKLTPDLMVTNVSETVIFYTENLGFRLDMLVPEDEKTIEAELTKDKKYVYAMVSKNEVFVMFMRRDVYEEDISALKDMPIGASVSFYIEVEDIEALYQELKPKVEIVRELKNAWYGMKEFYIKDCNGYILAFAERVQ